MGFSILSRKHPINGFNCGFFDFVPKNVLFQIKNPSLRDWDSK